ncbi:glycosyltransferase family 2 protein [Weissella cibaria]
MKQLSIIIPSFNSEDTINETINSVIRSAECLDYEILVIDNGSTDDTCNLVNKINHPEVQLLHTSRGRSKARNFGIQKATGKYLMLLDADDQICDGHLERGINYLDNHDDFFSYIDDTLLLRGETMLGKATIIKDKAYSDLVKENFIHISAPIFRNMDIALFDENLSFNEDWLFWIQNLKDKKMYVTNQHIGSLKLITGKNTMADPKMKSTRIYVYSHLDANELKKYVGIKRLLIDMIWYKMYQKNFIELENDIRGKFTGIYVLASLIIKTPFARVLLEKWVLKSETTLVYKAI